MFDLPLPEHDWQEIYAGAEDRWPIAVTCPRCGQTRPPMQAFVVPGTELPAAMRAELDARHAELLITPYAPSGQVILSTAHLLDLCCPTTPKERDACE